MLKVTRKKKEQFDIMKCKSGSLKETTKTSY